AGDGTPGEHRVPSRRERHLSPVALQQLDRKLMIELPALPGAAGHDAGRLDPAVEQPAVPAHGRFNLGNGVTEAGAQRRPEDGTAYPVPVDPVARLQREAVR